jgi:hypothetical protein
MPGPVPGIAFAQASSRGAVVFDRVSKDGGKFFMVRNARRGGALLTMRTVVGAGLSGSDGT